MLTRLRFTNFKSWADADLRLGRVTGLFGTNSSGKTSLIQFMLMLKQTKEATDRAISLELNGAYVSLGTYRDAVHGHDEERPIELALGFGRDKPENDLVLFDPDQKRTAELARSRSFELAATIVGRQGAPHAQRLRYAVGEAAFTLAPTKADENRFELTPDGISGFKFRRTQGRPWQLPGPVKGYAFPDQARTYFQNASFLSDLEAAFEAEIDRVYYLGPLREYPQRDYLWARSRPTDVGLRGQKAIDAILAATEAGERRNLRPKASTKSFQEMIAYWLREMGLIESFKVDEIKAGSNRWQALVRTRPHGPEVLLTDVGFGVSQVLPVITLLYYVPEGATVILEQPEIHLHPLAQAHLADLILGAAQRRRVQVILESHSEHLLLRLQRRIAEGKTSPDEVKLFFCDAVGSASRLRPLDLDIFGNIRNWPDRFMGDAFGETAAAEKARLQRMQAAE
jgi:predicted ATPase